MNNIALNPVMPRAGAAPVPPGMPKLSRAAALDLRRAYTGPPDEVCLINHDTHEVYGFTVDMQIEKVQQSNGQYYHWSVPQQRWVQQPR